MGKFDKLNREVEKLRIANANFKEALKKLGPAIDSWEEALNTCEVEAIIFYFKNVNETSELQKRLEYYEEKELYNVCAALKLILNNPTHKTASLSQETDV